MLSTSPNILQTFNCSGFASTSNETHRSDLKQASRHSMTVCTFLDKTVGICSGMRLLLNILFLISLDSRFNPFLKVTLQSWTEIERWYIARKITAKNILPIMMFFGRLLQAVDRVRLEYIFSAVSEETISTMFWLLYWIRPIVIMLMESIFILRNRFATLLV